MRLKRHHWIMLIMCTIALLCYQFGTPLINFMTINTLENADEIDTKA